PPGGPTTGHNAASASASAMSMRGLGGGAIPGRGDSSIGSITDPKINPNDDLGEERAATAAKSGPAASSSASPAGGPAKGHGGASGGRMGESSFGGDMSSSMSGGNNRGGGTGTNRYCDEKKEWRTRGFSLEVIMEHRQVPALLIALSNVEGWPIN